MPVPVAVVVVRTGGRRERPPALCPLWAGLPLAYVKGSLPFDRSLWRWAVGEPGRGVPLIYPRIYCCPCISARRFIS